MVLPLKVNGIMCPKCDDIIFSRAHHDFHSCTCGSVNIDGGFEYLRFGWNNDINRDDIIHVDIEFNSNITKEILYQDWNLRTDKYGILTYRNRSYEDVCEIKCFSEQPKKGSIYCTGQDFWNK